MPVRPILKPVTQNLGSKKRSVGDPTFGSPYLSRCGL